MCNSAYEYAMVNESQQLETNKGTLFGAYNAVTGYFQNVRTYKDSESKLKSLLYGGVGKMRAQKAFNLCMKLEEYAVYITPYSRFPGHASHGPFAPPFLFVTIYISV